ncbi:hypothetical protein, partial [uncultured Gemmiger sp.]|uniref:hypothetical protein n=1 Tax=uncultured Gemmiger sp. TaxID=1623490 RepID=UPI0027DAF48E
DISYYWLDCTERSRPFPTNLPKVRNRSVYHQLGAARSVWFVPQAQTPPYLLSFIFYLQKKGLSPPWIVVSA